MSRGTDPSVSWRGDDEVTIERCPHCKELTFQTVRVETRGGMMGVAGDTYADAIFLPDGCIAVFDEEEL